MRSAEIPTNGPQFDDRGFTELMGEIFSSMQKISEFWVAVIVEFEQSLLHICAMHCGGVTTIERLKC